MRKLITLAVIGRSFVAPAYAQSDWNALTTIPLGTRLRIESLRGGDAKGLLQAVDDAQITVQGTPPAARADIRMVEQLGRGQTGEFARRGLLIGAVCGGGLGVSTAQSRRRTWAALMALGRGAIGATI